MSGRIGKGSLCDPFNLDDGVESREGYNILGICVKIPRIVRVAANYRKRKELREEPQASCLKWG